MNDALSGEVVNSLKGVGVKLIAMPCAGYNNVDLRAAYRTIPVVRVPEYSPHAVVEVFSATYEEDSLGFSYGS